LPLLKFQPSYIINNTIQKDETNSKQRNLSQSSCARLDVCKAGFTRNPS